MYRVFLNLMLHKLKALEIYFHLPCKFCAWACCPDLVGAREPAAHCTRVKLLEEVVSGPR